MPSEKYSVTGWKEWSLQIIWLVHLSCSIFERFKTLVLLIIGVNWCFLRFLFLLHKLLFFIYHHIYYNPNAKDKSTDKSKSQDGLPINYSLITRDSKIPQLDGEKDEFYSLLKYYFFILLFYHLLFNYLIYLGSDVCLCN
jgi:hypothetical protein